VKTIGVDILLACTALGAVLNSEKQFPVRIAPGADAGVRVRFLGQPTNLPCVRSTIRWHDRALCCSGEYHRYVRMVSPTVRKGNHIVAPSLAKKGVVPLQKPLHRAKERSMNENEVERGFITRTFRRGHTIMNLHFTPEKPRKFSSPLFP
jgi:hypothetical protein